MDLHDMDMTISDAIAMLQWQVDMGADEAISSENINRYEAIRIQQEKKSARAQEILQQRNPPQKPPVRAQSAASAPLGTAEAVQAARNITANCKNLEELEQAINQFDGLKTLKQGASNTVIGDGNINADILILGEAPERDEDRSGRAFSGESGQLLDKMFQAIGLSRESFYASYLIFWRPPGGHTPNEGQISACLPFLHKRIELMQPKLIIGLGTKPAQILLNKNSSISRLRNKWEDIETTAEQKPKATALFSPSYLLKNPAQKKLAWEDLLKIRNFLDG